MLDNRRGGELVACVYRFVYTILRTGANFKSLTRAICRISAELAALSSQQNGLAQKKTFDENLPQQNFDASDELSNNFTQQSLRYLVHL